MVGLSASGSRLTAANISPTGRTVPSHQPTAARVAHTPTCALRDPCTASSVVSLPTAPARHHDAAVLNYRLPPPGPPPGEDLLAPHLSSAALKRPAEPAVSGQVAAHPALEKLVGSTSKGASADVKGVGQMDYHLLPMQVRAHRCSSVRESIPITGYVVW